MIFMDLTWSVWDWVILAVTIIVVIFIWGTWTHNHFKKRCIPYLQPAPFVGNQKFSVFRRNQEHFPDFVLRVYRVLKDHPYGGVFSFMQPLLLLRDPEIIKTVTVTNFDHFTDHHVFFDENSEPLWGKTLFHLRGQQWKDMRSTLNPAFSSSNLKVMFELINECCQQLFSFLEECQKEIPQGYEIEKDGEILVVELKDLYSRYSNDVIATTAFGVQVDSLRQPTNQFYLMGKSAVQITGTGSLKLYGYLISPKLMGTLGVTIISGKVIEFFRAVVDGTIAKREKEGIVRSDLIQLLVEAKKGTIQKDKQEEKTSESEDSVKNIAEITDDDIVAQALTFFLAGYEQISTLLSFASHQLATHPDIQVKLQLEIDNTLQENGGKFTYEAINSMKYLDMVISETLRMFPPVVIGDRVCVKPFVLEKEPPLEFQLGDKVLLPIYALHHDLNYFPDPERFDPERFSDENKHKINPLTYLPFGTGPRSCIGNRFALLGAKMAVACILSRYDIKVVAKTAMPLKVIQPGLTLTAEGGFWVGLEQRSSSNVVPEELHV